MRPPLNIQLQVLYYRLLNRETLFAVSPQKKANSAYKSSDGIGKAECIGLTVRYIYPMVNNARRILSYVFENSKRWLCLFKII